MRRFIGYVSAVLALATLQTVRGDCTQIKYFSLAPNDRSIVASLDVLFPELLFEFDSKAGLLAATGCGDQIALTQPFITAAKSGDPVKLHAEIDRQLWHRLPQSGLFRHPIYGFDLQNSGTAWSTVSIFPETAWAKRVGGHPLFGLTLSQKTARLIVLVADVDVTETAQQVGAMDSKLPPVTAPQSVADLKWANSLAGGSAFLMFAPTTVTSYSARTLWLAGNEKIVTERTYVAQPSATGQFTRLYLFMLVVPFADYNQPAQLLETFLRGFRMPAHPLSPVLTRTTAARLAAQRTAQDSPKDHPQLSVYQWRLAQNSSPAIQRALAPVTKPKEADQIWRDLLPTLSQPDVPEALWHLARAEFLQGKNALAEQTYQKLQTDFHTHPLAFPAALQQGTICGHNLRDWNRADEVWQAALNLAHDDSERRQVACQLAIVPFYRKQYRPALQALEQLLDEYPTFATATLYVRIFGT